jgi:hypothetical protein
MMGNGTKDEDSAVRKLGAATLELLERLAGSRTGRTVLVPPSRPSSPAPDEPAVPPSTVHSPPFPVHWIAVAGLVGAFVAWLITVAIGAGGADKTLDTVEASVASVSAELKMELKAMAEQRTAVAEAITELVVEVREIRKENREIVIALATLGALQSEQGLLVVTLQVEQGAAKEDRLRMQTVADTTDYQLDNTIVHVNTLKRRMSLVELRLGLDPPVNKGDG